MLITQAGSPPLIVTLGSFSLFRGLAEGITDGAVNYTGFPGAFLFGQGYLWGVVPTQLPILVVALVGYWVLLHRTASGAPVRDRLRPQARATRGSPSSGAWRWSICSRGWCRASRRSSTWRTWARRKPTPARAMSCGDHGGGAGRHVDLRRPRDDLGTLLGLFAIAVFQNGLRLAELPAELAGVLTGYSCSDHRARPPARARSSAHEATIDEGMK